MKEYIEREAVFKNFDHGCIYNLHSNEKRRELLEKIPIADVAPVVHGEWKMVQGEIGNPFNNQMVDTIDLFVCSVCGEHFDVSEARNYCPNCGAKMDGGKTDE